MQTARVIHPDGSRADYAPLNDVEFTLNELQGMVGGFIELIPSTEGENYCNEEGIPLGLAFNPHASKVLGIPLHGPVVCVFKD